MKTKTGICLFVLIAFSLLLICFYSSMLGANNFKFVDRKIKGDLHHEILWINKPPWIDLESINKGLTDMCQYKNCRMTDDAKDKKNKSAIVFSAQNNLDKTIDPRNKPKDQVWVLHRMEPPPIERNLRWFSDPIWTNTMNWSWGYRLDSDIIRPVKTFAARKTIPQRNYREIFQSKSKVAAWVVSHCYTQSRREEYVKQLIRHGVPVDIYGRCSPEKKIVDDETVKTLINKQYKFYLAFENSFCKDYVTEKFYHYYNLDVVLIVRGAFNYSQYYDRTTFIDSADFDSAKALADYILSVNANEELYINYLKQKDKYEVGPDKNLQLKMNCRLCEKLNNKHRYYSLYKNVTEYLFKGACYAPKDLKINF